ncbi:MAG: hypothetical protein ABJH68_02020 [Ilumatobacter sp.]|uniref:hypothetical protein n=1 Tax=Ilumatobacter sp. TaxID=1967498 RepID=UPI003296A67D
MKARIARSAVIALLLGAVVTSTASAAPAGRIEVDDPPVRTIDTRVGDGAPQGRVTTIQLGSGILQVWAVAPEAPGSAVVHPCSEPAPTDRVTFRLDPAQPVQFHRIFTSDSSCLTSTVPIHVIVDDGGSVSAASTGTADQYVPLPSPIAVSTQTLAGNATTRIPRPAQVTTDATAALVGLEALLSEEPGFISASGCDGPRPVFADLSFARGRVANVAAVSVDPGEDICVYASTAVTLRTTLLGELRSDGPNPEALPPRWNFVPAQVPAPSLRSINPVRRLDTRNGTGRAAVSNSGVLRPDTSTLRANTPLELSFGDLVGPLTTAVSMNVTAANARADGFLTVWPCTGARPEVSNLNFTTSGAVPNLVVTKLSPRGTVCIEASSEVHVIADVNGTYEDDGGLHAVPVEPVRILDTRSAVGTSIAGRVTAGNEIELQVTGAGVPADAGAATLNVTATGSDRNGFVTVYPCDASRPTTSNLNFRAGEASPNLVTTAVSTDGTVCLYTSQDVHLVADLSTWYGLDRPAGLVDLAPTRILDTRRPIGVATAGRVTPSTVVELDVAPTPGAAAGADAVVMNVTAAQADGIGFVTVWPCDQIRPTVSNLNIRPGRTVANLTTVKLSGTGTVCLATTSSTHLIADVAGYLTDVPVCGNALVLDP